MAGPFELRPYQTDLTDRIWEHLERSRSNSSILAQLPTGGGKTACQAELVAREYDRGGHILCAVHRREVLGQIAEAIEQHTGIAPELVTAGSRPDWKAPILLGMNQTLARRLDQLPRTFTLMLQDEAHHGTAGTYQALYGTLPRRCRLSGWTATPERRDGRPMADVFDIIEVGPSTAWLIEAGFLCPFRYLAAPLMTTAGVRRRGGDYDASELARANNPVHLAAGVVDSYRKHANGKQTVVFAVSVNHSRQIAHSLAEAGIDAVHIDGNTPLDERQQAIADFRAGRIQVLCNCDLFGEGVDIPAVEAVILARPTTSLTVFLQQIGRVLRTAPGKAEAIILDVADNWRRHGLPDDDREWSLEGRPRSTRNLTVNENSEVVEALPREVVEGRAELVDVHALPRQQAPFIPTLGQPPAPAAPIVDLVRQQQARGYKPAWCAFRLADDPIASQSLTNWQALADRLGYKPGWAWHKWQEARTRHRAIATSRP